MLRLDNDLLLCLRHGHESFRTVFLGHVNLQSEALRQKLLAAKLATDNPRLVEAGTELVMVLYALQGGEHHGAARYRA